MVAQLQPTGSNIHWVWSGSSWDLLPYGGGSSSGSSANNSGWSGNYLLSGSSIVTLSQSFSFVSGTVQSFLVPSGVASVGAYVWGPGGGDGPYATYYGGAGGFSSGTITVTPGDTLYVVVGGGGAPALTTTDVGGLGGWPNGGAGARGDASGGGGGGYSGIFTGSSTPQQINTIMLAGGGGGGTGYKAGGGGGGSVGLPGDGTFPGLGGTQSAGGAAGNGSTSAPKAGSALTGGDAVGSRTTSTANDGGGGGAGYFGGGGADGDANGGGGGSGYFHPTKVTGGSLQAGATGQSAAITKPAQTGSQYYSSSVGLGGSNAPSAGGDGRIVFVWNEFTGSTRTITYTTSSAVAVGFSTSELLTYPSDTSFYVSGTIGMTGSLARKSVFGGDIVVSGSISTALVKLFGVPSSSSWIGINQANATITDETGSVFISKPSQAGPQVSALFLSASTTPWKATALFAFSPTLGAVAGLGGMYLREASSGKLIGFGFHWDTSGGNGQWRMYLHKLNSPTSANSDYLASNYNMFAPYTWLQIEDNGTTRFHRISWDGKYFYQIYSVARTDFMTPNMVGWGVDTQGAQAQVRLVSWRVE